jgi:glycine/D-amino acid oxidase-like deaminating enzyme
MDGSAAKIVTRRAFVKAAALTGIGGAYFGGAHLLLRDERWTPNRSFWIHRGRATVRPSLAGEITADLAIVGGGVTGLSCALHSLLRSPGLKVVLLEAQYVGFGATGRSGGVLGNGTEMGPRPATEDNVPFVIDLIDRFGIACDLEQEPETQLDPYRYAVGLARAAEGLGARLHEGCRVRAIEDGRPIVLRGDSFTLRAPKVIVAINGYTPKLGIAASRLFPAHTAAAVTGPLPPSVLREIPDSILVPTSGEMYMWGRKAPEGRVLVGAGARYFYDNGLNYKGDRFLFPALHRCMAKSFPALASYPFQHAWTGPMGCTTDQEPIIGFADSPNIIYCGGYTGHGIAMGTKAGHFLAGMVHDEPPPSWMMRKTLGLPDEPLRYMAVNAGINLMNLGFWTMPKHD